MITILHIFRSIGAIGDNALSTTHRIKDYVIKIQKIILKNASFLKQELRKVNYPLRFIKMCSNISVLIEFYVRESTFYNPPINAPFLPKLNFLSSD